MEQGRSAEARHRDVGLRQELGRRMWLLGHRREREREGPRWLRGLKPLKQNSEAITGNRKYRSRLGYREDELFWVC